MTATKFLNHAPAGWFPLDVMKIDSLRKLDWCALMIDVHPDVLKCPSGVPRAQEAWVRIPGKHRTWEAAWDALEEMIATRH